MKPIPPGVKDLAGWKDLCRLDEDGDGLSDWEINFVESLMKQLKSGLFLTEKQSEKLFDIMEKRL